MMGEQAMKQEQQRQLLAREIKLKRGDLRPVIDSQYLKEHAECEWIVLGYKIEGWDKHARRLVVKNSEGKVFDPRFYIRPGEDTTKKDWNELMGNKDNWHTPSIWLSRIDKDAHSEEVQGSEFTISESAKKHPEQKGAEKSAVKSELKMLEGDRRELLERMVKETPMYKRIKGHVLGSGAIWKLDGKDEKIASIVGDFKDACGEFGVDLKYLDVLLSLGLTESDLKLGRKNKNPANLGYSHGIMGVSDFGGALAEYNRHHPKATIQIPSDPKSENEKRKKERDVIRVGVWYFGYLMKMYNDDVLKTVFAYNRGPENANDFFDSGDPIRESMLRRKAKYTSLVMEFEQLIKDIRSGELNRENRMEYLKAHGNKPLG